MSRQHHDDIWDFFREITRSGTVTGATSPHVATVFPRAIKRPEIFRDFSDLSISENLLPKPPTVTQLAACFFSWPADAHTLSGNDYWSGHLGIDIADGEGGAVYAADSGVVTMAQGGFNYGYGNVIQIDHGNGYSTVYAHLSNIGVGVCQSVSRGQWIGAAGNTGNSQGAHLHFEVRQNGGFINPWFVLP